MPLREFTDADRRVWQVWDTVPKGERAEEQFALNARLPGESSDHDHGGPEGADSHTRAMTPRFTEGREHGWLTFMCADEKRRLSPVPEGWMTADDAEHCKGERDVGGWAGAGGLRCRPS